MAVIAVFGIGGVGKTAIVTAAATRTPGILGLSAAHVMLDGLGHHDVDCIHGEPAMDARLYWRIDALPDHTFHEVMDEAFPRLIEKHASLPDRCIVVPMHLAQMRVSPDGRHRIVRYRRPWFREVFGHCVHVVASVDDIWRRRAADISGGARKRPPLSRGDIALLQSASLEEWSELSSDMGCGMTTVIQNGDGCLDDAVERFLQVVRSVW